MSSVPLSLQWYNLTTYRPKCNERSAGKNSMTIMMVDFGLHDLCGGMLGHDAYAYSRTTSPESSSSSAIYYPPVYSRPSIQIIVLVYCGNQHYEYKVNKPEDIT